MIKNCLGNSQNHSIPARVKSFLTKSFFTEQKQRVQLARADIIHSQHEIEVLFSALKNSLFPLAQSIKLHIRPLVLIPCLIPFHRCEKHATRTI